MIMSAKGKQYLVNVDLEGIHGIVGEPYKTLTASFDYKDAAVNAVKEINTVVKALYDSGAEKVVVWDNHGGSKNLDYSTIDPRADIISANTERKFGRFWFSEGYNFSGLILLGYHAREGTLGGVLAHTFSSTSIQYYKIDGAPIGEIEYDSYIAGSYGFSTLLVCSDDVALAQISEFLPDAKKVLSKYGKDRNEAEFIDEDAFLAELYNKTLEAVELTPALKNIEFPCVFEARYTRIEDGIKKYKKLTGMGMETEYGEDAHVVRTKLYNIEDFQKI